MDKNSFRNIPTCLKIGNIETSLRSLLQYNFFSLVPGIQLQLFSEEFQGEQDNIPGETPRPVPVVIRALCLPVTVRTSAVQGVVRDNEG